MSFTIKVRSLQGQTEIVELQPDSNVKDLKQKLLNTPISTCKLFHLGRELQLPQLLSDLNLGGSQFLTAISTGRTRKPPSSDSKVTSAEPTGNGIENEGPKAHLNYNAEPTARQIPHRAKQHGVPNVRKGASTELAADASDPGACQGLNPGVSSPLAPFTWPLHANESDSLCPGYLSRPNPSPQQPRAQHRPVGSEQQRLLSQAQSSGETRAGTLTFDEAALRQLPVVDGQGLSRGPEVGSEQQYSLLQACSGDDIRASALTIDETAGPCPIRGLEARSYENGHTAAAKGQCRSEGVDDVLELLTAMNHHVTTNTACQTGPCMTVAAEPKQSVDASEGTGLSCNAHSVAPSVPQKTDSGQCGRRREAAVTGISEQQVNEPQAKLQLRQSAIQRDECSTGLWLELSAELRTAPIARESNPKTLKLVEKGLSVGPRTAAAEKLDVLAYNDGPCPVQMSKCGERRLSPSTHVRCMNASTTIPGPVLEPAVAAEGCKSAQGQEAIAAQAEEGKHRRGRRPKGAPGKHTVDGKHSGGTEEVLVPDEAASKPDEDLVERKKRGARQRGKQPNSGNEQAGSHLPLPPQLERLERLFQRLVAVHHWMMGRHITPTLGACQRALACMETQDTSVKDTDKLISALSSERSHLGISTRSSPRTAKAKSDAKDLVSVRDILTIAMICPQIVAVRDRTQPHGHEDDGWGGNHSALGTVSAGDTSATAGGVAGASTSAGGSAGAGAGLGGSAVTGVGASDLDAGGAHGNGRAGEGEKQQQPKRTVGIEDSEQLVLELLDVDRSAKLAGSCGRRNVGARRLAEFRSTLVAAVAHIHACFLELLKAQANNTQASSRRRNATTPPSQCGLEGVRGDTGHRLRTREARRRGTSMKDVNRSFPGELPAVENGRGVHTVEASVASQARMPSASTEPAWLFQAAVTAAAEVPEDNPSVLDWDPFKEKSWHPSFPLHLITIQDTLTALRASQTGTPHHASLHNVNADASGPVCNQAVHLAAPGNLLSLNSLDVHQENKQGGQATQRKSGSGAAIAKLSPRARKNLRQAGRGGTAGGECTGGGFQLSDGEEGLGDQHAALLADLSFRVAPRFTTGPARPPVASKEHPPCKRTDELSAPDFLEHLKTLPWYQAQIVHVEDIAARLARHGMPHTPLVPEVTRALSACGVSQLFSHQAAAVDAVLAGHTTVIATSTASGKSLCYVVPLVQALASEPDLCALLMFPTKALAQDQARALRAVLKAAFGDQAPSVDVYDGDTPQSERPAIRASAQLLVTNPDMLHVSILPQHTTFRRILSRLYLVVVDEAHMYHGVFGAHAALVLRRLSRLCSHIYGNRPRFVLTSATIANPGLHAGRLVGRDDVVVVGEAEDGSPAGPRQFVLWNPPLAVGEAKEVLEESPAVKNAKRKAEREVEQAQHKLRQACKLLRLEQGLHTQPPFMDLTTEEADTNGMLPEQPKPMGETLDNQNDRSGGVAKNTGACSLEESARTLCANQEAAMHDSRAGEICKGSLSSRSLRKHSASDASSAAIPLSRPTADPALNCTGNINVPAYKSGTALGDMEKETNVRTSAVRQDQAHGITAPRMGSSLAGNRAQAHRLAPPPKVQVGPNCQLSQGSQVGIEGRNTVPRIGDCLEGYRAQARSFPPPPKVQVGPRWRLSEVEQVEIEARLREKAEAARAKLEEPPTAPKRLPYRKSPVVEIARLLAECVQHGATTIAFCKTRKLCELVMVYTREILKNSAPHLIGAVKVYRGGYSPSERRALEAALHAGILRGVAATSALELGVDIGGVDATLHLGVPGSIASLKQQAGRSGRRGRPSISIVVAYDGPLDQYFMTHTRELFVRSVEAAIFDLANPSVLDSHLTCAAAELPLCPNMDQELFGSALIPASTRLSAQQLLGPHPHATPSVSGPGLLHYVGVNPWPAKDIGLRAIDPVRYYVVNEVTGTVMEDIEARLAFFLVYDGAVYMHQGRSYLCTSLNIQTRTARVKPADVKYYTKPRDIKDVYVMGDKAAYPLAAPASTIPHPPRDRSLPTSTSLEAAVCPVAPAESHQVDVLSGMGAQGQSVQAPGSQMCARINEEHADDGIVQLASATVHSSPRIDRHRQQVDGSGAGVGCTVRRSVHSAESSKALEEMDGNKGSRGKRKERESEELENAEDEKHKEEEVEEVEEEAGIEDGVQPMPVCEPALVTTRFLGFHRIWHGNGAVFDTVDLDLPDVQMTTQAAYVRLPAGACRRLRTRGLCYRQGCHSANHAILNVLPLYVVCNAQDCGTECDVSITRRYRPERLLIFDNYPGGVGISAAAAPLLLELAQRGLELVEGCTCTQDTGCPACIHHSACRSYNEMLSKRAGIAMLRMVLGLPAH